MLCSGVRYLCAHYDMELKDPDLISAAKHKTVAKQICNYYNTNGN